MTFLALLVLLPLVFAAPVAAQWTSLGPGGGLIRTLAFAPTNPATLYAATYLGGTSG